MEAALGRKQIQVDYLDYPNLIKGLIVDAPSIVSRG
jgi:hypothetical protein